MRDNEEFLRNWYCHNGNYEGRDYDKWHDRAQQILSRYSLIGWHSTRLIDYEVRHIERYGMQLPNKEILYARIEAAQQHGYFTDDIAGKLKNKNEADDVWRKNRIWFTFYPPLRAGASGIYRLFKYWGGEALYNLHEDCAIVAPILQRIGTPFLIEAEVPIASLRPHSFLPDKLAIRYLRDNGLPTSEPTDHDDYAILPLTPSNIRKIIRFGTAEFERLTEYSTWPDYAKTGMP
jgi:hypothetical protein